MKHQTQLTFIDLFAGIGGFRIAFEWAGCKCVFSSEWDKFAQETYLANYGERPAGDITKISSRDIPSHDILTAGFPCQPFSIAGVSKHNALGNAHGFEHETQGTLFFDVARIINEKRPAAFVLENVKNLTTHDKGKTFRVILETLREDLGYQVFYKILDARTVVPQHRERIYIVGFREPHNFQFPQLPDLSPKISDILESDIEDKYTLTDHLWEYLQEYARKHKEKGNGFGFGLADLNGITRTLSARYYKDGAEILIPQKGKNPRRLTPRECARLMGYPDSFQIVCSDTRAYKQFGNSVAVPVVEVIAREVVRCLNAREVEASQWETARQLPLMI
ncbi:MAG: DNA-cytosine methyltransferase [Chloroflexi bacterium OLB15]|nr:MAG: DNA-cytosine methyltransferase [Chloroflexi bacterium OLB15]